VIVDQIGKFGDATDWIRAEKQKREKRALPTTPAPVFSVSRSKQEPCCGSLHINERSITRSNRRSEPSTMRIAR